MRLYPFRPSLIRLHSNLCLCFLLDRHARYDADHTKRVSLKLNTTTDADILRQLEQQPSMQGVHQRPDPERH